MVDVESRRKKADEEYKKFLSERMRSGEAWSGDDALPGDAVPPLVEESQSPQEIVEPPVEQPSQSVKYVPRPGLKEDLREKAAVEKRLERLPKKESFMRGVLKGIIERIDTKEAVVPVIEVSVSEAEELLLLKREKVKSLLAERDMTKNRLSNEFALRNNDIDVAYNKSVNNENAGFAAMEQVHKRRLDSFANEHQSSLARSKEQYLRSVFESTREADARVASLEQSIKKTEELLCQIRENEKKR